MVMCLGFMAGCGNAELKQGTYVTDDGLSSVTLSADNEFVFNRHIATSYRPTGKYNIKRNKLTLYVAEDEEYVFDIKNNTLVFKSGQAGLSPGTEFMLVE